MCWSTFRHSKFRFVFVFIYVKLLKAVNSMQTVQVNALRLFSVGVNKPSKQEQQQKKNTKEWITTWGLSLTLHDNLTSKGLNPTSHKLGLNKIIFFTSDFQPNIKKLKRNLVF